VDDVKLNNPAWGRYVRVLMNRSESTDGYILSELEVYGTGGPVAYAHPQASLRKDGKMDLAGGAWKLQRESLVHSNGEALSKSGFVDNDWIIATVPATVLTSYFNAGALPDPNFSDNQLLISDSYFYSDFWYRDEFTAPAIYKGKRLFLNFDGINWKAEVYLNGHKLGLIEGAFTRGQFDVTDILLPGEKNVLAVRIKKNDTPGFVKEQTKFSHDANGGEIGADNPTFHASVGWDWIPTIRGRNIGIYNDVYLSATGPVTIEDPFISTNLPLPDTTSAEITLALTLRNHTSNNVTGIVCGTFGTVRIERSVTLNALETKSVKLDPATHPSLRLKNPKLWWPNGYGNQNLYDVELKFVTTDGETSDLKSFQTGIREMSYSEDGGVLKIWVNGRRFIGFGGNWGFSESMLRYRAREYDIAVRYHKEMNFTMIRNWVGQTADDEFYEACDRYGIMIWQDFWLANPGDGPNPDNNTMFMQNVDNFVKRIRNQPSVGLY
jgi:beta-galactosidase/beta-glucuronidase